MIVTKTGLAAVVALGASFAWAETPAKTTVARKTTPAAKAASSAKASVSPEVAAAAKPILAALPADKMMSAAGFFGPVTKKYMPVYENLEREFLASSNKIAVLSKYLPQAKKALEEARAMKVSSRFEAEKAEYLQMFESALFYAQAAISMAGLQDRAKSKPVKSR